ncbi:MAG: FAD:protein FMN transferase [Candidatus Dormiibacterota bacterium]
MEHIMGTAIGLDLREPSVAGDVVDAFFDWLRSVDDRFSPFKEASMVSRVRRGTLDLADGDADLDEIVALCKALQSITQGRFDAWRHSRDGFDPSGVVKGWSIDRGCEILDAAGAQNYCVNAGGDVVARGEPEPGRQWRVGIRHPLQPSRVSAVVFARDLAVATSGTYERGEHIIDPATGRAPAGVLSITVAGPRLTYADAFATAAFAMGSSALNWVAGLDGYSGYAVSGEQRSSWTDGFDALLAPSGPSQLGVNGRS